MRTKSEKLFYRQSSILKWLLSLGHEIDDKYLHPDGPEAGVRRALHESVVIGGIEVIFDD